MFIAAVSTLTKNKRLFERVIPSGQSLSESNYNGAFRFIFWRYGEWTQVIVDDKLPTIDGQFVFMRSQNLTEFWSALLEKAYAKLNGGYFNLLAGHFSEAITDLTGGVCEDFLTNDYSCDELHEHLLRSYERGAFMMSWHKARTMGTPEQPLTALELQTLQEMKAYKLEVNHAYTISRIATITSYGVVKLVRLRNPWGRFEWIGEWSDNDPTWELISAAEKKRYHHAEDDGEFWMPVTEFRKKFNIIQICNLTPDALGKPLLHLCSRDWWQSRTIRDSWQVLDGATAVQNPHYELVLKDQDTFGDPELCTLLISLTISRADLMKGTFKTGFSVHKLEYTEDPSAAPNHTQIDAFHEWHKRDVTKRYCLKPAIYCIVPANERGEQAEFMLRLLTEKKISTPKTQYHPE